MALTCFPEQDNEDYQFALRIYPYILLISSLFLITTLIVYCILPEIRSNVHGVSVMCFVASLTSFYIGMAIIQLMHILPTTWFCIGIGIVLNLTLLIPHPIIMLTNLFVNDLQLYSYISLYLVPSLGSMS